MVKPNQNIFTKYKEMYLINSYRNATAAVVLPPNTFIGGVASVINTPALLAAKLQNYPSGTAFDEANITNFTTNGSDISCYIGVDYIILSFKDNTLLTYYIDEGNYVKDVVSFQSVRNMYYLKFDGITSLNRSYCFRNELTYGSGVYRPLTISMKNLVSLNNTEFYGQNDYSMILYAPNLQTIGIDALNNNVFYGVNHSDQKLYVHPSLETSNAGGVEGDIAYCITKLNTIRYVLNLTAPNPITDLSVGTIYGNAIQLNFTAPTGSTNVIDFYEVYVNGIYKKRIVSGDYVTGLSLNTNYNIEVKPIDIFYNKSTSNTVNVTTNATEPYPVGNLVSYYKMENNVLDSLDTNNGTATAITYEAGIVGQRAVFNGTTSRIITTNDTSLQLTQGTVVAIINSSAAGSGYRGIALKQNAYGLFLADGVLFTFSWGSATGITAGAKTTGINLNDGLDHIVSLVFSFGVVDGTKVYIDGILKLTTSIAVSNQTKAFVIGAGTPDEINQQINAKIDEVSIWNAVLTEVEISEISAKLNSGQSLI